MSSIRFESPRNRMNAHNRVELKRLTLGLAAIVIMAASAPTLARVLPSTLTGWANDAMSILPAAASTALGDMSVAPPPPPANPTDDVRSVTFSALNYDCSTGTNFDLKIGTT